jgi:hypothetical protein
VKTSRELDAKIAELLGWTEIVVKPLLHAEGLSVQGIRPDAKPSPYTGYIPKFEVPHYSTDIAAAWEVLEKFAEKDGHHSPAITSAFVGEGKAKGWCVSLGGVHSVFGDTAPRAICLAALKAMGDQ